MTDDSLEGSRIQSKITKEFGIVEAIRATKNELICFVTWSNGTNSPELAENLLMASKIEADYDKKIKELLS